QAPELRLAAAQGLLGQPPLDRDAGELRRVLHDFRVLAARETAVPPVDAERDEDFAIGGLDRRGPGGLEGGLEYFLATQSPERVLGHVGHEHLATEIHSSGAGAIANVYCRVLQ